MPDGKTKNNAVEFVHNLDLSQKVGQVEEDLKKEVRDERRKELRAEIDRLAYQALVQNKEDIGIEGTDLDNITPKELGENPKYEDLYKMAKAYTQSIPLDRTNNMLKNNLEDILSDIPQENLDDIGPRKEFNEALGNDELVREYKEIIKEAIQYKNVEGIVRKYKEGKEFEKGDEKGDERNFFYASIAESVGKKFKDILKNKGFSEESQNIGAGIAAFSASVGLVKKEIIDENADRAVNEAKKKFRDYEDKQGKKLVDYVKKGIEKLVKDKDKDTGKYNVASNLVYSAAKRYVKDNKLDANEEDYFNLLAA